MAEVINMPRLSDTMEEGTVAKWLKNVGDKVEEGDILAEIETDKATMEFESFYEGTLLHIGIPEGEGAPVDSLLAIIGKEGEDISSLLNGSAASSEVQEADAADEPVDDSSESSDEVSASAEVPEGVEIVKMPRLSDTMEEGTVAAWLKKVGDTVEEGEILAEIETDKATMEFESFYSGTLLYIGIQEGESSPVDAVLAIIGPAGTDVDAVLNAKPSSGGKASAPAETPKEAPKKEAAEPKSVNDGQRIFASPLAKKIAKEKGIDLSSVPGSGDNGRIVKKDVENYTPAAAPAAAPQKAAATAAAPASAPVILPVGEEGSEEVKNSQMRKTIAKRLSESKFTAPHYYLTIEVDMGNAMASRKQINDLPDTKVSFNDMVVKACAMALKKHPQVNTTWKGDTTRYNHHVHVGVAVAVDDGLVVPVVKFTDQLSLTQIGAAVKDLAGRARNKKLTPAEMDGSTFTVSNLGMFGITEFTSIINQPNSAILSVGAIVQKPVVKDGQIVVGNTMKVTLACDHRTVDGATGAQFLLTLRSYLENPVTMLA
ncbi:pyruvate dehydrogenase complex dihydrolipoamide acetyltransferase [Zobellia galactanivorans]|uniref:Acetyltransferase component of pyruvate dehydrogenase complex n=1 Tax=Zobellia galactanivorans (strain DSM 12802 / CCUG 47099 / CIP 106680 / NCIMB 13871 / Dsij) TaxID=63186 RepID=G0L265_ZOBGA|nr:pyruvate dehydrogenase complex dihydrolipoamide acetyltransferase [Zobellia galactanivorans]MDO6809382.1 pyruvate dehydrogenase complex dihydrolipoamide acetyltransferase [Zobellia galactanivorans]CAZ94952.1 Dihydrolipoyllysine-residue acetyltransferase, PDH complex E2 component [Zobellia galactanivorans]